LIFLPNPNNPTGTCLPVDKIERFARSLPDHVILCYDEAYYEYENEHLDVSALIREGIKIIGTRTFSKIYGLAGLRIGYGYGDPELISILNSVRPPFNTSNLSQAAAIAALDDDDWVKKSREANSIGMEQLTKGFIDLEYKPAGKSGNFILVELQRADHICDQLMKSGIIVRPVAGYGLLSHLRFSVGTESQNNRLLTKLRELHEKEKPEPGLNRS
jgi:histidinol-phosphate aminotransferase